jgi:hypothetical protein
MTTIIKFVYLGYALLALVCLAPCQVARAVSPPPDGGYPGGNTAEGQNALFSLTTGGYNTAVGYLSLRIDSTNSFNTALGAGTLVANTGESNTATGVGALLNNNIGSFNTATGVLALFSNTTASGNTAVGIEALYSNTDEGANTAVGNAALYTSTGCCNTAIGDHAGASITGFSNICIGMNVFGAAGENSTIRIGDNLPNGADQSACYIGGIAGQTVNPSGAGQVYIDNSGKLGVFLSSQRFKCDIRPMDEASEAILALKPVTFHYNGDAKNTPCFGLVAEQVAKVSPDLIVRDEHGEPLTVRYDAVNAMLLNEFLKEHKKVDAQQSKIEKEEATITELKAMLAQDHKQIEALAEGFRKVSTEIEMSKAATQVATNRQ